MNSIYEQITAINKAHGFDILAAHVKELKQVIRELIDKGGLDNLTPYTDKEQEKKFQEILNRAKKLAL